MTPDGLEGLGLASSLLAATLGTRTGESFIDCASICLAFPCLDRGGRSGRNLQGRCLPSGIRSGVRCPQALLIPGMASGSLGSGGFLQNEGTISLCVVKSYPGGDASANPASP